MGQQGANPQPAYLPELARGIELARFLPRIAGMRHDRTPGRTHARRDGQGSRREGPFPPLGGADEPWTRGALPGSRNPRFLPGRPRTERHVFRPGPGRCGDGPGANGFRVRTALRLQRHYRRNPGGDRRGRQRRDGSSGESTPPRSPASPRGRAGSGRAAGFYRGDFCAEPRPSRIRCWARPEIFCMSYSKWGSSCCSASWV